MKKNIPLNVLTHNEVDMLHERIERKRKLRHVLRSKGVVIYEGPSEIDGKPIIVIANGLDSKGSKNYKTGNMIQTWIMRQDIRPDHATLLGQDNSVCGTCEHRPASKNNPNGHGTCYVKVFQAPLGVWRAYHRGSYPRMLPGHIKSFENRPLRIGTYGDPAAVPFEVWEPLVNVASMHTAYTHQWQNSFCDKRYRQLAMASCDTAEQTKKAIKLGWRAFYVGTVNTEKLMLCPASEQANKRLNCEQCGACMGNPNNRGASVYIPPHGPTWKAKRVKEIEKRRLQHKKFSDLIAITKFRSDKMKQLENQYENIEY